MSAPLEARIGTSSGFQIFWAAGLSLLVGVVYFFSAPEDSPYDYTWRAARALFDGQVVMHEAPPPWLNEIVGLPDGKSFTTVFPLGAVLTMVPPQGVAVVVGCEKYPSRFLAGVVGAAGCFLSYLLAAGVSSGGSCWRPLLLGIAMTLGTWLWANVAFGGAWQLALGFAFVGELGALYFLLVRFRPLLAGCFFALAFGNRTEILLLVPLFFWLIWRRERGGCLPAVARFCAVPFLLGVSTLAYNHARFGAPTQFGYSLIAGVLEEPWYNEGIFALSFDYWWRNAWHMLFMPWNWAGHFPWLLPSPWGGSVFLYSPFLVLIFLCGGRPRDLLVMAWLAILLLVAVVFSHGNPGAWQISYRYAIPMLPWVLVLMASMTRVNARVEWALVGLGILLNGYAAFIFLRTGLLSS